MNFVGAVIENNLMDFLSFQQLLKKRKLDRCLLAVANIGLPVKSGTCLFIKKYLISWVNQFLQQLTEVVLRFLFFRYDSVKIILISKMTS